MAADLEDVELLGSVLDVGVGGRTSTGFIIAMVRFLALDQPSQRDTFSVSFALHPRHARKLAEGLRTRLDEGM